MIITTFGGAYICKQAFPLIKYQKSKYYSRLSDEHYLIQFYKYQHPIKCKEIKTN